ncbi:hypothetical protein CCR75_007530 [Bremia lactucae]|uniref:Temptin Cys/Cys disulfide domain-containing protein n=1 Tax=Bremia lactucae TaxID=4779 RepID=A0A976IC78_BRELC|nr:hypothetical protein CCR75_007530 [Bremia lactucae]
MSRATLSIAALASAVAVVSARPEYAQRVPNGLNYLNGVALGHIDPAGGGDLSPFGNDFNRLGEVWSPELCQLDSDNDGQTNGQELGDPCCLWQPDSTLVELRSLNISHPGLDTSMADPSLWSNVCGNVTSSASDDGTPVPAPSSNTPVTPTPTVSAATALTSVVYTAVAVSAVVAAYIV